MDGHKLKVETIILSGSIQSIMEIPFLIQEEFMNTEAVRHIIFPFHAHQMIQKVWLFIIKHLVVEATDKFVLMRGKSFLVSSVQRKRAAAETIPTANHTRPH
jgi:hypothetical protein